MSAPAAIPFLPHEALHTLALARLCAVLDAAGMPAFVADGCALGLHREHRIMDDDADVFVRCRSREAVLRAVQAAGFCCAPGPAGTPVVLLHHGYKVDLFTPDDLRTDYYQYHRDGWDLRRDAVTELCCNGAVRTVVTRHGIALPVLRDAERYLDLLYPPGSAADWHRVLHPLPPFAAACANCADLIGAELHLNGVFDPLHAGHIGLINAARGVSADVTVAVDADAVLAGYKRPLFSERDRLFSVLGLGVRARLQTGPWRADQLGPRGVVIFGAEDAQAAAAYAARWFPLLPGRVCWTPRHPVTSSTAIKSHLSRNPQSA